MKPLEAESEAKSRLWRALAGRAEDLVLYLAECHFHTVEAYVATERPEPMDEFELFVLRAANLLPQPNLQDLDSLLHVGKQVLRQIAVQFVSDGLLSEGTNGRFQITPRGLAALESGRVVRFEYARHLFHFAHPNNEYLRLRDPAGRILQDMKRYETPDPWHFDAGSITRCIAESDAWKKDRGFPAHVVRLATRDDVVSDQERQLGTSINRPEGGYFAPEAGPRGQFLVVDKAQRAHCAIVVRFENSQPVELKGYPLLKDGHRRGREVLFALASADSILKVFPGIAQSPSPQQIHNAWQSLGQTYDLQDVDHAVVHAEEGRIAIELTSKQVSEWLGFCWRVTAGEVFCSVEVADMSRLYKVVLEGQNEESAKQLRGMRLLSALRHTDQWGTVLGDRPSYTQWLSTKGFPADSDIYGLASLAWELGEFELAHHLAELEDMADAHV